MVFPIVLFIWEFVLDVMAVSRMTDDDKDTVWIVKAQPRGNRAGEQNWDQNHAF
jgi:hypothetical protein